MSTKIFNNLNARYQLSYKAHLSLGYAKNAEGFRADAFFPRKSLNVASIGCSNVLGWTLKEEETFAAVLCEKLGKIVGKSVNNWNLGLGGKSNDYIARTVWTCENTIKPDIYLIAFTGLGRREYWDATGNCIDYVPGNCEHDFKWILQNKPEEAFIHKKIYELTSPTENLINFVKNFQTINCLLTGKPWYYTFTSTDEPNGEAPGLNVLIDQSRYIGFIPTIDRAPDGLHPGATTNNMIAEAYLKRYLDEFVSKPHVQGSDKVVGNPKPFTLFNN